MVKKKKWRDMEITRIKLNPEQAVLACCFKGPFGMNISFSGNCNVGISVCASCGSNPNWGSCTRS